MDIDDNSRKTLLEAAFCTSLDAHRVNLVGGGVSLHATQIDDYAVSLEANGYFIQLIIPPSFTMPESESESESKSKSMLESDEVFLVTRIDSADNKALDTALRDLNEKLERIPVTQSTALTKVFDALLTALQKLAWSGDNNSSSDNSKESEMEGLSWESRTDDDENDDNYDAFFIEQSVIIKESHRRTKLPLPEFCKGFLFKSTCNAQRCCDQAKEEFPKFNEMVVDNVLFWSQVKPMPESFSVELQIEIGGVIMNDSVAIALGFCLTSPIRIVLIFCRSQWLLKSTKSKRDLIPLEFRFKPHNQIGHQYGIEFLIPDLVSLFFRFLETGSILGPYNHCSGHMKPEYTDMASELNEFGAMDNIFVGLLSFLGARLRALPNWCVVCWSSLPCTMGRLRTCNSEICLYKFEEVGLGIPVLQELKECPELVEFELSLAMAASKCYPSRDAFEPFPSFLLEEKQLRGRSGYFSSKKGKTEENPYATKTPKHGAAFVNCRKGDKNKNMLLLDTLLKSFPALERLMDCPDEVALKRELRICWLHNDKEGRENKQQVKKKNVLPKEQNWREKTGLLYDTLRFILSTNRLSLYLLPKKFRVDIIPALYEFAVLHDNPEREAYFKQRRAQEGGSVFAFHGSSAGNWFSIFRNGLQSMSHTQYMSTGALYGAGIYFARDINTSYQCSQGFGMGFGKLKHGFCVLSICEIIAGSFVEYSSNIMVVPPDKENDVVIRLIIVYMTGSNSNPRASHFMKHFLKGSSSDAFAAKAEGKELTLLERDETLLRLCSDIRSSYFTQQRNDQDARRKTRYEAVLNTFRISLSEAEEVAKETEKEVEENDHTMLSSTDDNWVDDTLSSSSRISTGTMHAIMKEHRNVIKQIQVERRKVKRDNNNEGIIATLAGIQINIPDQSNIFRWVVSLDPILFWNGPLYKDLMECAKVRGVEQVSIELEFLFPSTYPYLPPFARVVSPKFQFHTGHVTVGGSICMELLTDSGWSPAFSFESVLVQIVSAMIEGDARLDTYSWHSWTEYSESEARLAFERVARNHGWLKQRPTLNISPPDRCNHTPHLSYILTE